MLSGALAIRSGACVITGKRQEDIFQRALALIHGQEVHSCAEYSLGNGRTDIQRLFRVNDRVKLERCALSGIFCDRDVYAGYQINAAKRVAQGLLIVSENVDDDLLLMAHGRAEILWLITRDKLALVDNPYVIAETADIGENVRTQDDDVILPERSDIVEHLLLLLGIKSDGRLVQNDDLRIVDDGLRQSDTLLISL